MPVLFAGSLHVHYGFFFVTPEDELPPDLMETRRGQLNGLCGAGVPEVLSLVTGLHTGSVPVVIEWLDAEPDLDPGWEDVVEVSFQPTETDLMLSSFDEAHPLSLPRTGSHRVRYCALGMDQRRQEDTVIEGEAAPDRYLLQLWPSPRPGRHCRAPDE